jgi:hypothetical protein
VLSIEKATGLVKLDEVIISVATTHSQFKLDYPVIQNPEIKQDLSIGIEWITYKQQLKFEDILGSTVITFINNKSNGFHITPDRESLYEVHEKDVNEWIEKLLHWQQLWQHLLTEQLGAPPTVSADIDLDDWNLDYHNSISESILLRGEMLSTWNYKFEWGALSLSPFHLGLQYEIDIQITTWEQLIEECQFRKKVQDSAVNPMSFLRVSHTINLIEQLKDVFQFSDVMPQISPSGLVLRFGPSKTKIIIKIFPEPSGDKYHLYRFDSTKTQDVDKHSLITTVKRFMETKHL